MSAKKKFSLSVDLANGIKSTIVSASSNRGELHYDMMPIGLLKLDPNNPRKLSISLQEILNGIDKSSMGFDRKFKELESIKELAESIKRVGIRNAIEAYKDGMDYRVISGERRYLAAIKAGLKYVPVRINEKPDEFKLRYMQWVENINRQDLSLWEKYNNLTTIASAYKAANKVDFDVTSLKELLGVSEAQAYRYYSLLKADKEIIDLIKKDVLKNLKLVQEVMSQSKSERAQFLNAIINQNEGDNKISANKLTKLADKKRKLPTINLGKTNNITIARYLLDLIFADPRLQPRKQILDDLDWNSPKAVSNAFKTMISIIEKEMKAKETW